MKVENGWREASSSTHYWVRDASPDAVLHVLNEDVASPNGRSQWVWIRLPDGDLVLAVYPQGTTYETHEKEYP